ncbi:hypothetical protein GF324_10090 [bacterium]|nr:hypothetical protein [bacterium]
MLDFTMRDYLEAARSITERSLHPEVWTRLQAELRWRAKQGPLSVFEAGAGTGTMLLRLLEHGLLQRGSYYAIDTDGDLLAVLREHVFTWANKAGVHVEAMGEECVCLKTEQGDLRINTVQKDFLGYMDSFEPGPHYDLFVACSFFDLVNPIVSLEKLKVRMKAGALLYLPITFDGVTSLMPQLAADLDDDVIRLYHKSMDTRRSNGMVTCGSRAGRLMVHHLTVCGAIPMMVRSSDWVVNPIAGKYRRDEIFFLKCMLGFIEDALLKQKEIDPFQLDRWLRYRNRQIREGKLTFIAHNLDILFHRPQA